jgi:hypothetical protein
MNHEEALQRGSAEKYLLMEMSEAERSDFEAHYFDCLDCAADVRATAAFLAAARKSLRPSPATKPKPPVARKVSWFHFLWQPAFAGPVVAALLLVTIYQNTVELPRITRENVQLRTPEILTSLSLIGANSRGGGVPSLAIAKGQPLLISLDIPTAVPHLNYVCVLLAPKGAEWRLTVSADQARDTVAIRVPAAILEPGDYRLMVQGPSQAGEKPVDLASYRFTLTGLN